MESNLFWVEKYEPKTINDMVLTPQLKEYFNSIVKSKVRFNVLFSGAAGIGKTTLAKILANELDADILFIPCAERGGVSTAQNEIKSFCDSMAIGERQKIVILDELDSASGTQDNSFQKVLRNVISSSMDTMFFGTCNYLEKVISPIKSRLGPVNLSFTLKDLIQRLTYILKAENISFTAASLKSFAEKVIKNVYPDIRRIISLLQDACASGELKPIELTNTSDKDKFISELFEKVKTESPLKVREFYIKNKSNISDFQAFASEFFNWLIINKIAEINLDNPDLIINLSDKIYKINVVIDKEIQFFAFICELIKVLKK
jgi:DNA polymerase III delta prime subunit